MAAVYEIDENGVVHVMDPSGDKEFTFCNRSSDGDYGCDGVITEPHTGPSNCQECRRAIAELRDGIKGVRFANPQEPSHDD